MRTFGLLALVAFLVTSAAAAKDFGPGELGICGHTRCIEIGNHAVLRMLSAYYWGDGRAPRARPVPIGAPAFELELPDGHTSAIVAGARLDRFRAYGFNCGRSQRGRWYRIPPALARDLRRLTASLQPFRVARWLPRSC